MAWMMSALDLTPSTDVAEVDVGVVVLAESSAPGHVQLTVVAAQAYFVDEMTAVVVQPRVVKAEEDTMFVVVGDNFVEVDHEVVCIVAAHVAVEVWVVVRDGVGSEILVVDAVVVQTLDE